MGTKSKIGKKFYWAPMKMEAMSEIVEPQMIKLNAMIITEGITGDGPPPPIFLIILYFFFIACSKKDQAIVDIVSYSLISLIHEFFSLVILSIEDMIHFNIYIYSSLYIWYNLLLLCIGNYSPTCCNWRWKFINFLWLCRIYVFDPGPGSGGRRRRLCCMNDWCKWPILGFSMPLSIDELCTKICCFPFMIGDFE